MMMNRSHTTSYPRMSPIRRRKDRHLFHRDDRDVTNNNEDATIVQELHYNSNNNSTIVESTFNFDDFDTISSCNEKGEEEEDTDNLLLMNDDEDDDNSSNFMYSTMSDYGEYYDDDDVDHDAITADTTTTSVGMANPKRCTASSSSNTSNKRRKVTLNKTNKYNKKNSVAITPETTLKVVTDISFASIPPVATANADALTKNTTQTGRKLPYTSSLFLDDSYNISNGHGDENDPRVAGSNKTEENMVNLNYKPSVLVFDNKIYEYQYGGGSGEDTTTFEEEITRRPPPLSPIFGLPSIKEINNDDDDDDDDDADDTGDLLDNHLQVTTASYDEDKDDQHREYDILRNGDVYRILQSLVPLHESFTVLVLLLLHMEELASSSSSTDDGNTNCNGNTVVITNSVVQEACTIAYAMLVDAKGFGNNNNNSRKKKKQKAECCGKKLLGDIVDTLIDKVGPDVNFYCLFQHVERQQQHTHNTTAVCNSEGSITGNSTMNSILRLFFQQDDGLLEANKVVGNVATNGNDDSTSTQTTANVVAGVTSTRNDAINTTMASVAGAASHQSVVGVPTPPIATTTSSTLLPLAVAYGAMYYDHRRDTDVENEDNNNKNLLLEDFVMDTCEKLQWMTEYQQHNLWKTMMD